jgi:hypothetical protein
MRSDHQPNGPGRWRRMPHRRLVLSVLVACLVIALAAIEVARRSDSASTGHSPTVPSTSRTASTATTLEEEDEVVARLRAILRLRDRAYRERRFELLERVYTADCPCLRGDGDAIRQLIADDAVRVGASTSVQIRKLEKMNDRLWIVTANFLASPFRIETESGDLIRAVEGRNELFRFVLSRTTNGSDLLLGLAAPINDSG